MGLSDTENKLLGMPIKITRQSHTIKLTEKNKLGLLLESFFSGGGGGGGGGGGSFIMVTDLITLFYHSFWSFFWFSVGFFC